MREYIEAQEGFVLTNGVIVGKRIYLGQGMDKAGFYEISDAEYEKIAENESAL